MRKGQSPLPFKTFVERLASVSEVSWARLAAYLDAEGSIAINRVSPNGKRKTPAFSLRVAVGNSDPRLIVWLKNTFGGWAGPQKQTHKEGRVLSKKPRFLWAVNCHQAAYVLEQCLPYFVCKKDQAEVGIAFQQLLTKTRCRTGRGHSVPLTNVSEREEFHQKLKAMHSEIISSGDLGTVPTKE